jgi:hypothetical protein
VTGLLNTQTQAQSERPLKFLSKQCNEDAITIHLDPGPFQDFIGPEFPLAFEEGKARVLIVVQDCAQYWIDGEDVGVLIHGLEDVRPVVGAERTLPTRTWFTLFDGSTNQRVRAARTASGTLQAPIDSVSLDPPGPGRGGRVFLGGNVNYSWGVLSPATPSARLVGVNHDVYARDPAGNVVLNRVQVLMHVSAGPSRGTLKVVGSTDPLPMIGPGTYPVSVQTFFPMWG